VVEQKAAEEEGEQHDEHTQQIRDSLVADADADEKTNHGGCQVEQDEEEHELEELGRRRDQARHGVHDAAHDSRRQNPQGNNIEDDFRQVVGERIVVPFRALADE
jgi:hypothetical protein